MRNLKIVFITIIILSSYSLSCGQDMSCEDLKRYRDELPVLYSNAIEKEKQKFANLSEYKNDLENILSEMNKDGDMLDIGTFIQSIKLVVDALNTTLSLTGVSSDLVKTLNSSAAKITASNAGKKDFIEAFGGKILSSIPVINTLYSVYNNVNDLESFTKAKGELSRSIRSLKDKISQLDQEIKNSTPNSDALNQYTQYIDEQLNVICK